MDEKQLNLEYSKLAATLGDVEFKINLLGTQKGLLLRKISEVNEQMTMLKKLTKTPAPEIKPVKRSATDDQKGENKEV